MELLAYQTSVLVKFAYLNSNISESENILKKGYFPGIMIVSHYLVVPDTGTLYILSMQLLQWPWN